MNAIDYDTCYDAVIVGAGPAGSMMASALAALNWRVLLVERDRFPAHKVCGEFLSPEAQKGLRNQGLYEIIAALEPVPLDGAALFAHNGRALTLEMPGQAWGISRFALDAALAAAAEQRGAALWTGTTVTSWQPEGKHFTVQLRRGPHATPAAAAQEESSTIRTRALVMACGRHILPGLLPDTYPRQNNSTEHLHVGIKCHFAQLSMPAQVELYLFEGGYVGINPIENQKANVCALASYDAFGLAGRSPLAMIEAAATWNPRFGARIRHAVALPETQCAVAPVDTRRKSCAWIGVPLLGDSAVMIPPLCGDGMAMALRSAELCASLVDSYLRAKISWHEMGNRYHHLWHCEFDRRLRTGSWLESMLQRPTTTDLLFRLGATLPFLPNYFVQATRGVSA